jgi:hypothetical protein
MNDDFYIGYMPEAPKRLASFVKKVIIAIGVSICCLSFLLVWWQKKFASTNFEYGVNTTLVGYLSTEPVPHLVLSLGTAADGKELFQNVLLVGEGKAGAAGVIEDIGQTAGRSLAGSRIKLTGSLIYGDGRALMQISKEQNRNIEFLENGTPPPAQLPGPASVVVSGEIVDPKCYFGVMKPADGKEHRSCAIRCIAGGIPPLFHSAGSMEYLLLVNEASVPLSQEVLGLTGDQITIHGDVILWNDWKILKVKEQTLKEIAQLKKQRDQLIAFENGITKCNGE